MDQHDQADTESWHVKKCVFIFIPQSFTDSCWKVVGLCRHTIMTAEGHKMGIWLQYVLNK